MDSSQMRYQLSGELVDELEAMAERKAREAVASFAGLMLEAIGEDPQAPLAQKIASGLGSALEKYGSQS